MSRRDTLRTNGLWVDERSVSPVIATVLMVAIVVVIAASIGSVAFGFTDRLGSTDVAASDGQCLQSVGFDPNDVESFADSATADLDCRLWYDATQESFSDSQEVSQWTDQSGNGFHATSSAVVAGNPTYAENLDGVSAMRFSDGADVDGLDTDATAGEIGLAGDQRFTMVTVVRPDQNSNGAVLHIGEGDADSTGWAFQPDLSNDQWLFQAEGENGYIIIYDDNDDAEKWFVFTHVYDGNDVSIYKNGEPIYENGELDVPGAGAFPAGGEFQPDVTNTPLNIGYFNFDPAVDEPGFDGAIAEMVVLNKAFEDKDREVIECELDEKHGSAVNVNRC